MDRDLSIIAQNAGSTAAAIMGTYIPFDGAESLDDYLARYEQVREFVFQGTLNRAVGAVPPSQPRPKDVTPEQATERITKAFGDDVKAEAVTCRVIEKESAGWIGQPAPDWLAKEFTYQVSKGKIAADDNELFDNRARLPQFGGDGNAKAPWFKTSKGKVGLWPPSPKGGK